MNPAIPQSTQRVRRRTAMVGLGAVMAIGLVGAGCGQDEVRPTAPDVTRARPGGTVTTTVIGGSDTTVADEDEATTTSTSTTTSSSTTTTSPTTAN